MVACWQHAAALGLRRHFLLRLLARLRRAAGLFSPVRRQLHLNLELGALDASQ